MREFYFQQRATITKRQRYREYAKTAQQSQTRRNKFQKRDWSPTNLANNITTKRSDHEYHIFDAGFWQYFWTHATR